jgi:hypothetical protein
MLREVLRLLGVDLDHKLAEIRAQAEELKTRTAHPVTEQVQKTGLMIGFAFVGAVAAIATFIIALVALYPWVDLYRGPLAGLTAVGMVLALSAAVMFALAFGRRSRKPASAVVDRRLASPSPPSPPPPQPMSAVLSAALPSLPRNASLFDVLTHRFSTRVAVAIDAVIDAAVHVMRAGSKSALFGNVGGRRPGRRTARPPPLVTPVGES